MIVDAVVIGAGFNGLVAAGALAGAGRRVLLVERLPEVGGLARLWGDTRRLLPSVAQELGVKRGEPERIELAGGGSLDGPEVRAWQEGIARWRPLVLGLLERPAPQVLGQARLWEAVQAAVAFRRLGQADLLELLRVGPMAVEDWLAEQIADPRLRAGLAMDGLFGTWMGPRSPGSTATLLLWALSAGDPVVGGAEALVAAARARCVERGVELRTGVAVTGIRVSRGQVVGVTLDEGVDVDASVVLSTLDPAATVGLLPIEEVPPALDDVARVYRCRGTHAVVRFRGEGTRRVRVVRDPDQLERAFDAVKYGELAQDPPIDARLVDGQGTACVFGAPYALREGWTEAARSLVGEAVERALGGSVEEVLAPPDLEARFGCTGGHLLHGEHALDQLWVGRPGLRLSRHRTPIRGLFLGSGATHPGGGLTGGPGRLAARAVLEGAG